MGEITKKHGGGAYLSAVEILLDSGEKILLTNSGFGGYKIKTIKFGFMLNTVWTCDNYERLEKLTKELKKNIPEITKISTDPLELIAYGIIYKFKSLSEIQRNL